MYGYIYMTTNLINKKKYIGQHKSNNFDANYYGSGKFLRIAIDRYGIENFKVEVIQECKNKDELDNAERYWIKHFNAQRDRSFYNVASGGNFGDVSKGLTEEQYKKWIENISKSQKGLHLGEKNGMYKKGYKIAGKKNGMYGRSGNKNPFYGKKHSLEHCEKDGMRAKRQLEEYHPMEGRNHSEESIVKMKQNHSKSSGKPLAVAMIFGDESLEFCSIVQAYKYCKENNIVDISITVFTKQVKKAINGEYLKYGHYWSFK